MKLSLLWFVVSLSVYDNGECSCVFKNQPYEIDAVFKDPENLCLTYTCTKEGFTTKVEECPNQSWCKKELRTYDKNGCCYTCNNDCRLVPLKMTISKKSCRGNIKMFMCTGHCKQLASYSDKDRQMKNQCVCCKETEYTDKTERLFCAGGSIKNYKYKQVAACSCTPCKND